MYIWHCDNYLWSLCNVRNRYIGIKYIQLLTITKQDIYLTIPVDGKTVSVTDENIRMNQQISRSFTNTTIVTSNMIQMCKWQSIKINTVKCHWCSKRYLPTFLWFKTRDLGMKTSQLITISCIAEPPQHRTTAAHDSFCFCAPLVTSQSEILMSLHHWSHHRARCWCHYTGITVLNHWLRHKDLCHHCPMISRLHHHCRTVLMPHHHCWTVLMPRQAAQQSRRSSWSVASCKCCQRWGCLQHSKLTITRSLWDKHGPQHTEHNTLSTTHKPQTLTTNTDYKHWPQTLITNTESF